TLVPPAPPAAMDRAGRSSCSPRPLPDAGLLAPRFVAPGLLAVGPCVSCLRRAGLRGPPVSHARPLYRNTSDSQETSLAGCIAVRGRLELPGDLRAIIGKSLPD